MAKSRKIEEQKGPIQLNKPTYKWGDQTERMRERGEQIRAVKDGQTMRLHTPKN